MVKHENKDEEKALKEQNKADEKALKEQHKAEEKAAPKEVRKELKTMDALVDVAGCLIALGRRDRIAREPVGR